MGEMEMDLLKLIDNYGRACRRDGSPAWESDEGQALKVALESRASNAGGVHPDHLVLLKPFMSERDGLLSHSLTVYLREMADPEFAERMHKARVRLYTASNAGGAVAAGHFVLRNGLWYDVGPEHRMAQPLYTHPAPTSKEPVADERAPLPAVSNTLAGFRGGWIAVNGHPPLDQDIWNAGVRSGMTRAALATAQTPEGWKLVPSKPTPEMIEAGNAVFSDGRTYALPVYANMLAAAPAKPEGV